MESDGTMETLFGIVKFREKLKCKLEINVNCKLTFTYKLKYSIFRIQKGRSLGKGDLEKYEFPYFKILNNKFICSN